jgi:hypothetical protein
MLFKRSSVICVAGRPFRALAAPLAFGLITLAASMLVLTVSGDAQAATAANAQSPLGINLSAVNYYSTQLPFLNNFVTVGQWITHGNSAWDTSEEQYVNLDANGWPKTLASVNQPSSQQYSSLGVLFFRGLPSTPNGHYPAGQYVVLYDGQGTLTYGFDASLVSRSAGRDIINVATPSTAGIDLRITVTDPNHTGNYIRNIRVVKAENEAAIKAGEVFNPTFLALIQKFRVLRFMDWFATNGSTVSSWSNRPVPSYAYWGTRSGVPIEIAVQLANTISADAWLNVPHMADDNYITQMATLVHAQLGTTQKAYVEFSNEVWNGSFEQYHYAVTKGKALWPSQPGGGGGYGWNRNWFGMRTAQMCDIWKSVWGADSNRVVCVLGSQAAGSYSAIASLTCPFWTQGAPCSGHGIGAIAIAPYFGYQGVPSAWTSQSDGGLTDLFQSLYSQNDPSIPAGGALNQVVGWETEFISGIAPYKLPLIAYEGGQSYANASTAALTNLYIAANRDPRMGAAYTKYLQQWKANGGRVFVHYDDISAPSGYGEWGALESIMQTTSPLSSAPPKWQALQNFITANPCWWSGCTGTIGSTPPRSNPHGSGQSKGARIFGLPTVTRGQVGTARYYETAFSMLWPSFPSCFC